MKEIPLTQGKVALVDDEDFEKVNQWKWGLSMGYAGVCSKGKVILMHRLIMNTPKGKLTDHINHNGLDNRKENLRICTQSENQINRGKPKNNTSGYKGVTFHKCRNKWLSRITTKNKTTHLGSFNTKEEAYVVYREASKKYHGEFSSV